jgi:C-terminal processing protease CtpA/Prc
MSTVLIHFLVVAFTSPGFAQIAPPSPTTAEPKQEKPTADRSGQGPSEESIIYHDWSNGIDFVRDERGRITLMVPEKNADTGKLENKTYRAESIDEFTRKYPDLAKKYHVRALASPREASEALRRTWEHFRESMKADEFAGESSLENWLDREEGFLQKHRDAWSDGEPGDKGHLGVLVGAAGATLRSQLGLSDSEGVVIHAVRPGSLAERSGLKKHDVVTRLNDKPVKDVASFREEVTQAIQSDHFTLEVFRGGKSQQITVRPAPEKKPSDQKSSN